MNAASCPPSRIECEAGHQLAKPSVNTWKARSGGACTKTERRTGAIVASLM